jgi:hypothetical protein
LVSMRIRLLTSMRIRIQGAKPIRSHADADTDPDPGQTFSVSKTCIFYIRKILYVGRASDCKCQSRKSPGLDPGIQRRNTYILYNKFTSQVGLPHGQACLDNHRSSLSFLSLLCLYLKTLGSCPCWSENFRQRLRYKRLAI